MAKRGFRIMDSDMHIIEPPDLWQRYIAPEFRDGAPVGQTSFPRDRASTFLKDVNCLGSRGVIAVFGSSSGAVEAFDIAALARVGGYVTRTGMGHYTGTREEWLRRSNELLGWVQTGKLKVSATEYPLAQAARAHTDLQGRKTVGKLLLIP